MNPDERIRVILPRKGEMLLLPRDHLATGGEGAVYLKDGLVFKLYLDPAGARTRGMEEKIGLLSKIRHPSIVAPIDIVCDRQHRMVGFYMEAAPGVPLVKTFTNSWRDANGFTGAESIKLVENMRKTVNEAHALCALVVDGNEMNWLVEGTQPRVIDVDGWQIDRFQATAVMASIVDYHTAVPSQESDWFSWGIVTFQVFTGIHPYKGTHPDFRRGDMEARMRANASVFDSRVKLNGAVRDFSVIPKPLAAWYEGVFEKGERSAPPSATISAVPAAAPRTFRARAAGSGLLKHERTLTLPGPIRYVTPNGVALYEGPGGLSACDLQRRQPLAGLRPDALGRLIANQACLVRHGLGFVLLELADPGISGRIVTAERDPAPPSPIMAPLPCLAEKLLAWGNRVFALSSLNEHGLTEIALESLGASAFLSIKDSWPVNLLSTRFFEGFAVTDCLGAPFIVQPEGDSAVLIHSAAGLRDYHLVSGYAGNRFCIVLHAIRRTDGRLCRLALKLGAAGYEVTSSSTEDVADIPVAVTHKGIAVAIFEEGEVSVWNTLGTQTRKIFDPAATLQMRLFALPGGLYYRTGCDVFRLSLY